MKFIPKMAKLVCENCNKSYLLPKNGNIKKAGDKRCPIDKF